MKRMKTERMEKKIRERVHLSNAFQSIFKLCLVSYLLFSGFFCPINTFLFLFFGLRLYFSNLSNSYKIKTRLSKVWIKPLSLQFRPTNPDSLLS